jgi:para-nitrobenzyl esterase
MTASSTVTLRQGRLRGIRQDDHVVWRGIPYAQPPTGTLRWKAPRPAPSWDGVREATEFGPQALQTAMEEDAARLPPHVSGEDCLYLNVCAPARPAPPRGRPVLLWIHGGGYLQGCGQLVGDGEAFARAGIVVVTFNYRLGALGFTHWGGLFGAREADAGVCGLLDQIAALRWVRENIAAFGGDPERVTVYGVSAGAKSVANLMASPAGQGLFSQAVSSSGGADHVATPEAGTAVALRLLKELGCDDVDAARALPGQDILAAQARVPAALPALWLWRPTVHPTVLPTIPIESIRRGSAAGVRLLLGTNGNEASVFALLYGAEEVTAPAPGVLRGILGEEGYGNLLRTYRRSRGLPDDTAALVAAMSDERYGIPTLRLADAQAEHGPVYHYRIDIASPGYPKVLDGCHGTETSMPWRFLKRIPGVPVTEAGPARQRAAEQVHQAWVSFVRDGVPAADGLPEWPRHDAASRPVLVFDEDSRVEHDPRRDERLAWGDATWPSGTWFPVD